MNDLVYNADADTDVDLEDDAVLVEELLDFGEAVSVPLPVSVFDAEHVLLTAHAEVKATSSRSLIKELSRTSLKALEALNAVAHISNKKRICIVS